LRTIDFEGDYGRDYKEKIHTWLPGYDLLHETAVTAVQALQADAKSVLFVGPGPGDEVVSVLDVCPEAAVTLVEPSQQMLEACHQTLAEHAKSRAVEALQMTLEEAYESTLQGMAFDVVVCHAVLHLIEGAAKDRALQHLASLTAQGGLLVISGSCLTDDPVASRTLREVAGQRLLNRGMDPEPARRCVERPDDVSCILKPWLDAQLIPAGFDRPLKLVQVLHHNLWIAQKRSPAVRPRRSLRRLLQRLLRQ